MSVYHCPVCHRPVVSINSGAHIRAHHDNSHRPCPASGHPFFITYEGS